jgi:hypothetical protein
MRRLDVSFFFFDTIRTLRSVMYIW